MNDALALRQALEPGKTVVLIGGGVIGLEVASAAIARGCKVTVLEKADTLLPQIGSPALSRYARQLHSSKGVDVVCAASIKQATARGLELDDGRFVAADLVLVGVGVEPSAELARQLGLQVDQGVKVTPSGATPVDGIYAAGDVAEQWSRCHDRWMRARKLGQRTKSGDCHREKHGRRGSTPYDAPPWFWSDQYDANIQIVGHPGGGEEIVRGDIVDGPFTTISLRDGEVIGGVTVNSARDMSVLRRLVSSRKDVRSKPIWKTRLLN